MQFSIDVAIVTRDEDGNWYRLIHEKTGYAHLDRYYWNKVATQRASRTGWTGSKSTTDGPRSGSAT